MTKAVILCPACGCDQQHTYSPPGHPELKGRAIYSLNRDGITYCQLVACEQCGNIFDATLSKRFYKNGKLQLKAGDPAIWLQKR